MQKSTLIRRTTGLLQDGLNSRGSFWTCRACTQKAQWLQIRPQQHQRSIATRAKTAKPAGLTGLDDVDTTLSSPPAHRAVSSARDATEYAENRALKRIDDILGECKEVLRSDIVPTEKEVLHSLHLCRKWARYLKEVKEQPALSTIRPGSEVSNLLFKDDEYTPDISPVAIGNMATSITERVKDKVSDVINRIAESENIFLTPEILKQIVESSALLGRPENLARIFILYSSKPIPVPNTTPVKYYEANPNKPTAAVPLELAQKALDAAIDAQNLPLCLDIIEHTVCTKAYKRMKVLKKALIPALGVSMVPFASYAIASQLAQMQEAMSTTTMTFIGTAGIMTYLGATGTMGFIALATANDQMERVTWASGTHLRQRWLREDERAFMDKVACAWGFKNKLRRGEEEGQDWSALKELCGIRGMVLDRVELMEGMQ